MQNNNLKKMVFTALFIAISIIIPVQFGFLRIVIGPFSATIASHVPMFFAMLLSPAAAVAVGIGSTIGFILSGLPAPVIARASMHIIVGAVGALLIKREVSFTKVIAITAPIHGILEAISVIPFVGLNVYKLLVVVCVGTILHHSVDGTISAILVKSLSKAMKRDLSKNMLDA